MMNKDIYILGVGNNTAVYIELLEDCGFSIQGLYHYSNDRVGEDYHGYKIVGSYTDLFEKSSLEGLNFALSHGENKLRSELFFKIKVNGGNIPSLVHPSALVSRSAILGEGVVIHMQTIIHPNTNIGDNTVFSYNTSLSHNASIGSHCYVAFGTGIGAYTQIGNHVFLGQASVILSSKVSSIGDYALVGAGAVVTNDVPAAAIVAGIPAKIIKMRDLK